MNADAGLDARLHTLTLSDRADIQRLLRTIRQRERAAKPASKLREKALRQLAAAEARAAARRSTRLRLNFPEQLPIARMRDEIAAALQAHPVIVVCGDTGSGKTTQLPKICLAAGRGIAGSIAHTQPRRIAARAVASRLAEELDVELGGPVGLKVRFTDHSDTNSLVKVMTDGILLNEIRSDPALLGYDTIIVDEAHERSLNIDFLLGYCKRLLERRNDLKLIVTSATIDPERFAAHFDSAPIVRVEGRSFPVTVRYRGNEPAEEMHDAIVAAAHDLAGIDLAEIGGGTARDILVFLPGERWIRDAARALERNGPRAYELLPLYARLTTGQQQRIFKPGRKPRIVLATNIAETSLTVPRIRFVIDTGLARVSRYATRHRVQRLAVEPIAQANAVQRAGRCGRLAPGLCLRLFDEPDFAARPAFMEPEILRTDLAGVILKLAALRIGKVEEFPFLDAPPTKAVNDAYRLLYVLGAMDGDRALTEDGKLMARLPLDPRLAKLLLSAQSGGVLSEALVLAAALSVVDPREYPADRRDAARERHAEFADTRSDFIAYLNLWQAYQTARRGGEKSFRGWCAERFVSAARLREWSDVHSQLAELVRSFGWSLARHSQDYQTLHQVVLSAFVDFVAEREEARSYRGMHEARAALFPGSPLAAKPPRWVVAAEHVATERAYLRTVAQINPRWIPTVAPHLVKREYSDPRWDKKRGQVTAREIVSIFGLVLSSERRVNFGRIDAAAARQIFIRDGLASDALGERLAFLDHNRRSRAYVLAWEDRLRSRDLYIGDRALAKAYDAALPAHVADRAALRVWCRRKDQARRLEIDPKDLASRDLGALPANRYPQMLEVAGQKLNLRYRYAPGEADDGITLKVPVVLLASVPPDEVDWLVPGYLEHKVLALLRTLPKELRRPLVPMPDTCAALMPALERRFGQQNLIDAVRELLLEQHAVAVPADAFNPRALEPHLSMRIDVIDEAGASIASSRDLRALQIELAAHESALGRQAAFTDPAWTRRGLSGWDFDPLPERVRVRRYGGDLELYPALVEAGTSVDLRLLPPGPAARRNHRHGVRRLLLKRIPQQVAWVRDRVLGDHELLLNYHGIGSGNDLIDDLLLAVADECFLPGEDVRDAEAFNNSLAAGRAAFVPTAEALVGSIGELLAKHRGVRARLASLGERAADVREDIQAQLDELVGPRLLSSTPPEWRGELLRYLRAIELRLDAWPQRIAKDAEYQAMVRDAWRPYDEWRAARPADWPQPPAVVHYRWLTEEFRVSLFAQRLGTRVPVSKKRLDAAWAKALAEPNR